MEASHGRVFEVDSGHDLMTSEPAAVPLLLLPLAEL